MSLASLRARLCRPLLASATRGACFHGRNSFTPLRSMSTETYMSDEQLLNERLYPKPKRWPRYNEIIQRPEDGPVERYYCHYRDNIKYSPKKMFYIAGFIRGMSIDEAIKQLSYVGLKGASIVIEVLKEAQKIAISDHHFEYASKMWIAESFVSKGIVFRGLRKHARMRFGEIRYFHCHYYVKLVEGDPPVDFQRPLECEHYPNIYKPEERLKNHIEQLRKRRIDFAL